MRYDYWTPEQRSRHEEVQRRREQDSHDMERAYDIVRAAMRLFETPELQTLKNAMHLASVFLNDELEEMEDEAQELGLDAWIVKQQEDEEAEEKEHQDREE